MVQKAWYHFVPARVDQVNGSGIKNRDPEQLPAMFLIPLINRCRLVPVGSTAVGPGEWYQSNLVQLF
jgi:hypothetical protein